MNSNTVPDSGSPVPAWCREYVELFSSGIAHLFILTGDIAGRTVTGSPQRMVLRDLLSHKRQIVICYDRARGISFPVDDERARSPLASEQQKAVWESHRQQALQILQRGAASSVPSSSATALAATLTAAGLAGQATGDLFSTARRPVDAFALLEQLLRAPQAREQVAVIVDYCDLLCPPMDKSVMSPDDRQLLTTLLIWGQDPSLASANNPIFLLSRSLDEIHADLRSSSSGARVLDIALPDTQQRVQYLQRQMQQRQERGRTAIALVDLELAEMATLTPGLGLQHLEDILLLAETKGGLTRALVKARKDAIIASEYSSVAELIDPLAGGFAAIGGMDSLVRWARDEVIAPLQEGRRDVPKGVLLVGPPGTGKTFWIRALAAEIGFNAVALKAENILGGIVGESERKLREFFAFVRRMKPVLIFCDEIDQSDWSRRGNGSGNPVASNLFSMMLQFMSDEETRGEAITFFASNRPDLIDRALLRFGRIDRIIPVLLPDEQARRSILLAQIRGQEVSASEEALAELASRTTNYSPADLAAVVAKATRFAQRARRADMTLQDASQALRCILPATPQIAEYYTLLAIEACNDAEFLPPPYDALLRDRSTLQAQISTAREASSSAFREKRVW